MLTCGWSRRLKVVTGKNRPVVVDRDALARLEEWGGRELMVNMLRIFLEHAPKRMEKIREGADSGPLSAAEDGAHSLKSSAGNLGARRLQSLAAEVENRASEGDVEGVTALLPDLEAAFDEARTALDEAIEDLTGEA